MANFKTFTSEEALDDYFSSLLDEEIIELDSKPEDIILPEPEPEPEPGPEITWHSSSVTVEAPEPQYQPQFSASVDDDDDYPFELPQLEDVQRLLSQLESSQLEAQIEIDALILEDAEFNVNIEPTPVLVAEETKSESEDVSEEDLDLSAWDLSDKVTVTPSSETVIDDTQTVENSLDAIDENQDDKTESQLETKAGKAPPPSGLDWKNVEHDNEFQVLFFEVMGVTFAVPLAQLGGIHQITELSHLIGRPDWYLGLQNSRETKIDALDTAKWVMPQSIKDDSYKEGYQYLVMLGESKWGLACNALAGTETITSDRIRWRETAGKRPWLSGMVKEKMCALIHVEAMITMLNAGLDIKGIE
jgi:purine-binding chemotaxis protein CheW